jgi:hypothetical protein
MAFIATSGTVHDIAGSPNGTRNYGCSVGQGNLSSTTRASVRRTSIPRKNARASRFLQNSNSEKQPARLSLQSSADTTYLCILIDKVSHINACRLWSTRSARIEQCLSLPCCALDSVREICTVFFSSCWFRYPRFHFVESFKEARDTPPICLDSSSRDLFQLPQSSSNDRLQGFG